MVQGPQYRQPFERPYRQPWRDWLHEVIFEADTPAGRLFDVLLILTILASVAAVMLDSVKSINIVYSDHLYTLEWIFTILFSIEYILRLLSVDRPMAYATSFYGVIDLLAILPTYISLVLPGAQYFMVIRVLRVLRIFQGIQIGSLS